MREIVNEEIGGSTREPLKILKICTGFFFVIDFSFSSFFSLSAFVFVIKITSCEGRQH